MRRLFFLGVFLLTFSFSTRAADAPARQFRVGAATSNVTPPLGVSINGGMTDRRATHIHDELHARCMVLDDGKSQLALVVVDSCMVPKNVVDDAKRLIEQRTKIPPDHVLISATHTHESATTAPVFQSEPDPDHVKFLGIRIADGVQRAADNLAPAKIGWAVGREPNQVFNRRWTMKEGTIPPDPFGTKTDRVRMNPPVGSADLLEPAGPIDPEVWVLSAITPDGKPIAILANYSLHYVGGEGPGAISADYYGYFAARIAELLKAEHQDPPFVGMMSNATSGNINNINFKGGQPPRKPYEQMKLVADAVAQAAYDAVQKIEYRDDISLSAAAAILDLGVRKPSAVELERAKGILSRATAPVQVTLDGVYAKETVAMAQCPDTVPVTVAVMKIGDLAICAIPCEVFVEIGLEIKQKSPVKSVFTIGLANGYNGYLPTPEHHKLGGYETWRAKSSYLEIDASTMITAKLMELLSGLKK